MHEVRERMLQERDRAVEREREAASLRLREQSERFDQQLLAQRARLTEDMAQVSSSFVSSSFVSSSFFPFLPTPPFAPPGPWAKGSVGVQQLCRICAALHSCAAPPLVHRWHAGMLRACTRDALHFLQHRVASKLQALTGHVRSFA